LYMSFHERIWDMTDTEISTVYARIQDTLIDRETDLNTPCINLIRAHATGTVLEVGCGSGYLSDLLSGNHAVTACDFALAPDLQEKYPAITFTECTAEKLPWTDKSFDTVIS